MITVTLLLGKDTVSIYKKTGIIPPEENTADSGGYMITRQFGTEVEYRAYAMAMEDLEGHRDWQMLAPVTSPAPSIRTEDFVRLTDGAVGSICRSFGDGPADYRKEMLFGQELNQNQMDMNCKKNQAITTFIHGIQTINRHSHAIQKHGNNHLRDTV